MHTRLKKTTYFHKNLEIDNYFLQYGLLLMKVQIMFAFSSLQIFLI